LNNQIYWVIQIYLKRTEHADPCKITKYMNNKIEHHNNSINKLNNESMFSLIIFTYHHPS